MTRLVRLADLRLDGGTQPRTAIDEAVVAEYAQAMAGGAEFPPLVVFFDGADHWLADGFHRQWAARKINFENLPADVRSGTRRDAVLFSVGANNAHGMRRTNADKRRAAETLLKDEEWSQWSNEAIAAACAVHPDYVQRLRRAAAEATTDQTGRSADRKYVKNGKEASMTVANIGGHAGKATRDRIVEVLRADVHASNAILAARAGCHPDTVCHVRKDLGLPQASKSIRSQGTEERRQRFASAMDGLQGFVQGLRSSGVADFAGDERNPRWREQITELISALRAVRQELADHAETGGGSE